MEKRTKRGKKNRLKVQPGLTPEQVAGALRHILTSTLALYVLNDSRRPIRESIKDLMDMEFRAGQLVGMILRLQTEGIRAPALKETLTAAFSYVPISAFNPPQRNGAPGNSLKKAKP